LEALGGHWREEKEGEVQHWGQGRHKRALAASVIATHNQDDEDWQQRVDEQLPLKRVDAKATHVQPWDPTKQLQSQRAEEGARDRRDPLRIMHTVDVTQLRKDLSKAEEEFELHF
jgi:hypothetical protein